jgi:carbamoylphosphate synthase large subunit
MFKVLFACYANWDTTAEIPYLLKKSGCNVDIYCSNKSWLLSNSFHDIWIPSSPQKEKYLEELIILLKKEQYDWIILESDVLINYLNAFLEDEDIFKKIMPISNIEHRYMLSSKNGFSKFCIENGIDTPGYYTYNKREDAEEIKNKLKFPVVNKLEFSWGGTDMFISWNYEEFIANLDKLPIDQNVLIQEYINGEELRIDALYYKGILVTYLSANALDYSKSKFSYNTRRNYYENKLILPQLIELGSKLGLNGFAHITYIHNPSTGKYNLIEVDPRPNSWIAYSRFIAKNNFFEGVKRIVSGEYINGFQKMGIFKPNVEIGLFYKDIRRAIWKKDKKGILRWVLNSKGYWRFLPLYDLKLTKRVISEIWEEVFIFKWKRMFRRN